MAKILIVDDETDIVQLIVRFAEHEGHTVTTACNGKEAVSLCRQNSYDVIIMDIMMPEMDGFAACKEIRSKQDIPVIMLSALGQEYDKLMGFELGIDDYVVKPFSPKELMARINVVVSRHKKNIKPRDEIILGGLKIEPLGRNVYIDGIKAELTAKEYDLLLYFIENKGIALSREKILNALWGYDYTAEDRTVDWQIKLLRSKLGKYRSYIVTLRGMGYKFEDNS
ncbi:MAG: response regulator transcription factor [Lachnospiraceae bacterium]